MEIRNNKNKVFIYFIATILLIISCKNHKNLSQCEICQSNVDVSQELFTNLLSDSLHYYLIGTLEKDIRDFRTNEITIQRAEINNKKNWTSFSEKIPGICQTACLTKTSIFLISRQQFDEPQNPMFTRHKLYRISKRNGKIEELYVWKEGNTYIDNVYFVNDKLGFIFYNNLGNPLNRQILRTGDGGKEWDILNINSQIGRPKFLFNRILFSPNRYSIHSVNLKGDLLDSLQFKKINIIDFTIDKNKYFWILGKNEDKTVLQCYKNGKTTEIKYFSDISGYSPKLYKYNDIILVLGSQIDRKIFGGFGGTKPIIYLSKNNGITWEKQQVSDEVLYFNPISFCNQELIAYVGIGQLFWCKL